MEFIFRPLNEAEIDLDLLVNFHRRQAVRLCRRKINGRFILVSDPFTDDWDGADRVRVVQKLREILVAGGLVEGAFLGRRLVGFIAVRREPLGSRGQYRDLASLHVSEEFRGRGLGRALFRLGEAFAWQSGGEKLYISAHSALESQAFYLAMGCREAEEYDAGHAESEPCDCQMERVLDGPF